MRTSRLLLLSLCISSTVFAATPAEVTQAKALFSAGAAAYEKSRFAEAAAQFAEAYTLVPKPAILFSLAQAEKKQYYANGRNQGVLRQAIAHYEQYLKDVPSGERRDDATNALADLVPQVKQGADVPVQQSATADASKAPLTVSVAASDAKVSVDGAPAVEAPFIGEVTPGKHRIVVTAPGYEAASRDVVTEGGRRTAMEMPMQELPGTIEIVSNRSADVFIDGLPSGRTGTTGRINAAPGEHMLSLSSNGSPLYSEPVRVERGKVVKQVVVLRDSTQRTLSYVTLVVGGVTVLASGLVGLGALGLQKEAQDLLDQRGTTLNAEGLKRYEDKVAQRDSASSAAFALLGVGGAVLLVGGGLLLFDKPTPNITSIPKREAPPPTKRLDIEATRLVPWATPQGGGAALLGTFKL
jgi:tetratricopeptide (TPR) repeat protein